MTPDHADLGIPGLERPEVIGQGGFGTVYSVDEPEFGRKVAVKVLHDRLDGEAVRRAFVRECQAMGSLSGHPHIVTVHRGGTTEHGTPYIVMDLMSEGSLADRMARSGPLPWAEALEVAVLVAGALETAHRAGILHLDLKPANVLVSRYGEPKLGDFGISRISGVTATENGQIRATTAYAAPERLLDGVATPAADLYGLGATMFALLTGKPAFVTDTDDLIVAVARIVREPLPDLRPRGVPEPVQQVMERLMAKSPNDRYTSASEAAMALQEAQRAMGRPMTRAVIEGELPPRGSPTAWAPRPLGAEAPPPVSGPAAAAPPPMSGWPTLTAAPPGRAAQSEVRPPMPSPTPGGQRPVPAPTLIGQPPVPPPVWYPPSTPPPAAPRPGRRPVIVAVVVAVVLIVALGTGGAVLYLNWPTTQVTANPPVTPTAAAPSSEAPVTIPPDEVVAVADGVTHPATVDVRAVLREYITGINESRYADAFAQLHPDSNSYRSGLEQWQQGQLSTTIISPLIISVADAGLYDVEAVVTFTSFQSEEDGPDGQTCTNWELAYDMAGPGPNWLIRGARALTPPQAC